jgi:hypothetical protein
MPELVGALVVATGFLVLVVRDLLVAHGVVVRSLERHASTTEPPEGARTVPDHRGPGQPADSARRDRELVEDP